MEDSQLPVVYAAHVALKELAGTDLGPAADASRADRAKAMAKWREWWKSQNEK